jgi:hypothetical protein
MAVVSEQAVNLTFMIGERKEPYVKERMYSVLQGISSDVRRSFDGRL